MRSTVLGLSITSVVFSGAIFGFFYAWVCSTMWGLDRADPRVAIAAMQAMNASVRNAVFFPAFFLTPAVLGLTAAAAYFSGRGAAAFWFGAAAAVYLVFGADAHIHGQRADERGTGRDCHSWRHRGGAGYLAGLFAAMAGLEPGEGAGFRNSPGFCSFGSVKAMTASGLTRGMSQESSHGASAP
ncbi:hypothetical protein [Rhizobium leguminosarum]|uniref:hypothetical protein n=1 Tax=Rhizobium leguminosarum TaxID=384 RepID=UPI003F983B93